MQAAERPKPKPVVDAERRAAFAERQVKAAADTASRDRAEAMRLARDFADMREDRDRWRAQAEKLGDALERLRPLVAAPASSTSAGGEPRGDTDLLYGVPAIAAFLGLAARQARHLADTKALPTFKLPGNKIICGRRSTLNAWLGAREAATDQGGN